jgi:hypothetical protein
MPFKQFNLFHDTIEWMLFDGVCHNVDVISVLMQIIK